MKTTLLIMAAGIGSRFGSGIKQLESVDNKGHIIMDYSVHDAIEVGFNHVVFIIRKDIEKEFKEVIGDRIEKVCQENHVNVEYVFQDINDIPGELPEGRTKPWGTGQAVLQQKSSTVRLLLLMQMITMAKKVSKQYMNTWSMAANPVWPVLC